MTQDRLPPVAALKRTENDDVRWPADRRVAAVVNVRAFILALGTFAIGTDAFIIGGILPEIAHDLSASVGKTGLVVSVFSLSYALGSPIISALSVYWRRSTVMVGGLTLFSAANLLSALSPTLACLLATRVIAALAAGLVAPASYALASTLGSSHNRGKIMATVAAGFTSAIVLGVPLGVFIGKYAGWRGSLIFVAILGARECRSLIRPKAQPASTNNCGLWAVPKPSLSLRHS
jgi:DHA1 family inner membrane transport protein